MTPQGHIEDLKKRAESFVDRHPHNASGMMIYYDFLSVMDKWEQYCNLTGLLKETEDVDTQTNRTLDSKDSQGDIQKSHA